LRVLDVAVGLVKALTGAKPQISSKDAQEEMKRRARINMEAEAKRGELDRALFGRSRHWIGPRPGWLDRRER
jgi:hypothetical protein